MAARAGGLGWEGRSPTSHGSLGHGRTTMTLGWHTQPLKGNSIPAGKTVEAHKGSLQGWWAQGHGEPLAQAPGDACGCKAPHPGCSWQFALPKVPLPELCLVPSLPTPRWLCAGRDGYTLSSGCTWAASGLKRALEMRQSRMGSLSKPSSPSLCAPRTVREKERCFFLSFSLRPRRAEFPCADTRQAAQRRTKLLSVVLFPAIRVPAASPAPCLLSRSPACHPAALPTAVRCPRQGPLSRGCFPPSVPDCPVGLSRLCSPRLLHPSHGRRGSDGPQHASPKQTNPGKQACK